MRVASRLNDPIRGLHSVFRTLFYILLLPGHSFVSSFWCLSMDYLPRTRLLSRQTLVHSPYCASPSIDDDASILIILHARLTFFVLLLFLSTSAALS